MFFTECPLLSLEAYFCSKVVDFQGKNLPRQEWSPACSYDLSNPNRVSCFKTVRAWTWLILKFGSIVVTDIKMLLIVLDQFFINQHCQIDSTSLQGKYDLYRFGGSGMDFLLILTPYNRGDADLYCLPASIGLPPDPINNVWSSGLTARPFSLLSTPTVHRDYFCSSKGLPLWHLDCWSASWNPI